MSLKRSITNILLLLLIKGLYAGDGTDKFTQNISNSTAGFTENKGQIADQFGNVRSDLLYLYTNKNLIVQLKVNGFSYEMCSVINDSVYHDPENYNDSNYIFIKTHRVDIELIGSNPEPAVINEGRSNDYNNYYTQYTGEKGVTYVYNYQKVTYKNIYPNIDLTFYTNKENEIKYDFIVKPGGDVSDIQLTYKGTGIYIDSENKLIIPTSEGDIQEFIPKCYTTTGINIPANYILNKNIIKFKVGNYNKQEILIIDPSLMWGTYYDGDTGLPTSHAGSAVTDNNRNVFIYGSTMATNGIATSGGFQSTTNGSLDLFVAKFNSDGVRQWGTYYGGTKSETGDGEIIIDNLGNIYVCGSTFSTDMGTAGAFKSSMTLGANNGLFAKFDNNGIRIWSSYYGADDATWTRGHGIAVDNSGNVFFTGKTNSPNNIATAGSYQSLLAGSSDIYLAKLDNNGAVCQWGTYYGGSQDEILFNNSWAGYDCIETDASGNIYLAGETKSTSGIATPGAYKTSFSGVYDAFFAKFDTNGNILWGSYYGGANLDAGQGVAVDNNENTVYFSGITQSPTNIATAGAHQTSIADGVYSDAFLVKFNSSGARQWATYYGGTNATYAADEDVPCVDIDECGNIYICGSTGSINNISTPGSYQENVNDGSSDVFFARFNSNGVRLYATYYGGTNTDLGRYIEIDKDNEIYFGGTTQSTAGIATVGAHQTSYVGGGFLSGYLVKFGTIVDAGPDQTICKDDTTTLNASGGGTYEWSTGETDQSITVAPTVTTTYTLTVYVDDCFHKDSVVINVLSGITADAGNDQTICTGGTATLTASGGDTYLWNTGETDLSINVTPGATITYTVTVMSGGCSDEDSVVVNVLSNITADAGNDETICTGGTATLTANGGGTYVWNTGGTGQSITVTPATATTYTVTVTSGGCTDKDSVAVDISTPPVISAGSDQSICRDSAATLTATGGNTYLWNNGNTTASITVSPPVTTTYIVTGTDANNCTDSDETIIDIIEHPDVNLGTDTCINTGSFMFLDAGTGYDYLWQDGSTGQTYITSNPGTYRVIVSNDCGNASDSVDISQCEESSLWVPSAFSPNGDGSNDKFLPACLHITDFEMFIYDRWGQKIFYTTDENEGWDGKYKGKMCSQGVYVWKISYKEIEGDIKKTKTGHVTLLD